MKLSLLFLIISLTQVSASAKAQSITINRQNVHIVTVFEEIMKQTDYDFVYSEKQIAGAKKISISALNTSVTEVLEKCFEKQPFTYTIKNKTITVVPKQTTFFKRIIKHFLTIDVRGIVQDENSLPLVGATVKVKGGATSVSTNSKGEFFIQNVGEDAILVVSYIGYYVKEVPAAVNIGIIKLDLASDDLKEVEVVSTGYQQIPKERATGSFTQVDEKTINRSVGINILDRLEGVTSGLLLNRGLDRTANNSAISVRGRSTIFANAAPLIVLDGFPYDGTIEQINAADIETINILKDAAAASIWGTKASNGVIVLTSKKGRKNQALAIGLSSTFTVSDKPDLYYIPQISSADFIDLEQYLFRAGYYNRTIGLKYSPISLAIEVMNRKTSDFITAADSIAQIDAMKAHDVRHELNKYAYRTKVYQQYQMNISGGSEHNQYYLSGGFNKNMESIITNNYDRLTLNARNNLSLIKEKLDISADFNLNTSNANSRANAYNPYSPYDRLTDDKGNALAVVKTQRISYIDTAGNGKLLDWNYRPKEEFIPNRKNNITQYKLNLGLNYKITNGLLASANYQYLNEDGSDKTNYDLNSYYARNLINTYSSISGNTVTTGIPMGNILDRSLGNLKTKIARFQLTYSKVIANDHEINAIAGYESNDGRIETNNEVLFGYKPETLTNGNNTINPLTTYKYYYSNQRTTFSTAPGQTNIVNFTQSYYSNISYSYKSRYILTASARKDESNLFGVETNQKGVPLWSTGLAWNISRESFYHLDWLPNLKLRATYGYNGNIDKTLSGSLTIQNFGRTNYWGSVYSTILNPPNSELKWEKVKTWNLGLDYTSKNNRLSGSIDMYQKNATDLIGNSPISMETGVTQFKGNNADLKTNGIDLVINSRNLVNAIEWTTSFLINYNTDKVTSYKTKQSSNYNIVSGNFNNPWQGYPYYGIFSFPSAGLDATGDPQGYLNGVVSKDYSTIVNALNPGELKYHGSASPKYFGSIINSIGYKGLELSINIIYKFDYYFRRTSVFSGSNYLFRQGGYEERWQKQGDELNTKIPSLVYPSNTFRDVFFQNSEDLVERGDHIRLQDARISYQMPNSILRNSPLKKAGVFIYTQNLGILWRRTKLNIDPDYGTTNIPQPFNCSLGINVTL